MSLREKRIISSMTPEAQRKLAQNKAEGKDPITGKKDASVDAACPACEIKNKPNKHSTDNTGGAA